MIENIEQAVEALNRHGWRGRDDWHCCQADLAATHPMGDGHIGRQRPLFFDAEDAIAIANHLESREVIKAIRSGFVTCVSEGGKGSYIRIDYPALKETQRVHGLINRWR